MKQSSPALEIKKPNKSHLDKVAKVSIITDVIQVTHMTDNKK